MRIRKKLLILDFDGTLADTRGPIVRTLGMTMDAVLGLGREGNRPLPSDEEMARTIGLPLREAFLRLVPGLDGLRADLCAETYRGIFEVNRRRLGVRLFPGVADTLRSLSRRGVWLSLASSRGHASLAGLAAEAGILPYISYILGAEDVRRAKPWPEAVLLTLAAFGLEPPEALVVGDMPYDVRMGQAAGVQTCGVTYGNATRRELEAAGADRTIDGFADVAALV